MHPCFRGRAVVCGLLATLSVLLGASGASARSKHKPRSEDLARIYVFYSEPPFAHARGEAIRIRLVTLWDRDRKEQEIRKEVALRGADMVILERSLLEFDGPLTIVGPRGKPMIKVPSRTAYVEGHLARRADGPLPCACERAYSVGFNDAWNGVKDTAATLGWRVTVVDTDSRYVTARPGAPIAVMLKCENGKPDGLSAVFTVLVRSYANASVVRLDVAFADAATGKRSTCRTTGTLEDVFFQKLEERLGPTASAG